MNKTIKHLKAKAFEPYGTIIEFTEQMSDGWEILIRAENTGWRIALLEIERKVTHIFEHHPTSKETFEPVSGVTLLIVATNDMPQDYEVFLLDKPICLNEGVWHQVISLSEKSLVKITENLEVSCVYYEVPYEIEPSMS